MLRATLLVLHVYKCAYGYFSFKNAGSGSPVLYMREGWQPLPHAPTASPDLGTSTYKTHTNKDNTGLIALHCIQKVSIKSGMLTLRPGLGPEAQKTGLDLGLMTVVTSASSSLASQSRSF